MSQRERYLQIKSIKFCRKFVGHFFTILSGYELYADVPLHTSLSHSNYVPLVTVAMVTIIFVISTRSS